MKNATLNNLKPITKQDKLLDNLIRTSKSHEEYYVTHDPAIDKIGKKIDPKDYE